MTALSVLHGWAATLQAGSVVTIDASSSDPSKLYAVSVGRDVEVLKDAAVFDSVTRRMRRMHIVTVERDKRWWGELSCAVRQTIAESNRQRAS